MTVVRPHSQWGVALIDDDDRVDGLREKPRLRALDQRRLLLLRAGVPRLPRASDSVLEREPLRAARRRRPSSRAYRHEGFWDCMDTYKDAVTLNDLWAAGEAPWAIWERQRAEAEWVAALVTGGRGFVGAWLARRCSSAAREVVSLDRRTPRERPSTLGAARDRGRGRPRSGGDLARRRARWRGRCAEHGVDDRLPPRRADDRRHGRRRRRCAAFETNVRGTWTLLEACRERGVERVVVASSDKAYGAHDELPYREDFALQPTAPYEASKAAADLIARSYWPSLRPAGRGDPVREHLRRRRPQLLAPDPGGGQRRARRAARRCSAPTARPSATSSTSRTRPPPTWRSPTRSTATTCAARRSTPAAGGRTAVGEVVEMIAELAGTGVEPDIRGDGQPGGRDRPPVRRRDEDPRALRLGARGRPGRGPGADDRVVPRPPRGASRPMSPSD